MKITLSKISVMLIAFSIFVGLSSICNIGYSVSMEEADNTDIITEPHVYPVLPGSAEWSTFYEPEQKLAACYVSPDELNRMTTDALVETVINYPLLIDMYAFESIDIGIEEVSTHFAGIEELFSRDDAAQSLSDYYQQAKARDASNIKIEYANTLLECLSNSTEDIHESDQIVPHIRNTYVKTPKGSDVFVQEGVTWAHQNISYDKAVAYIEVYLETYPSARLIADVNPSYNCHSYAFYSQSISNNYWMPDPTQYFTDQSYISCPAKFGARVYYTRRDGKSNHSAIVTKVSSGSNPTTVASKWGYSGVFTHFTKDCPYGNSISNVTS